MEMDIQLLSMTLEVVKEPTSEDPRVDSTYDNLNMYPDCSDWTIIQQACQDSPKTNLRIWFTARVRAEGEDIFESTGPPPALDEYLKEADNDIETIGETEEMRQDVTRDGSLSLLLSNSFVTLTTTMPQSTPH